MFSSWSGNFTRNRTTSLATRVDDGWIGKALYGKRYLRISVSYSYNDIISIYLCITIILANTCVVSWRWCLQKEEISTSHSLSQSYLAMVLLWELWTANGFFTPRRAWVCISSLGAAAVGTTTAHVICRYYTRCVINKTNGIRIKRGCISSRLLIINSYFHGCITINLMWNEVQQQQHKICITLPYIHIHGKCISSAHPIFAR